LQSPIGQKKPGSSFHFCHPERKRQSGSDRGISNNPGFPSTFTSGYALTVLLIDATIYLDYLANRFRTAGGTIQSAHISKMDEIPRDFDVIINCAGIGARELVHDSDLEPHRGQVAIVPKIDLAQAIICNDAPLMYAIPRAHDCVFGGTNSISENREPSSADTTAIVSECSRVLGIDPPPVIAMKVGLRPFRKIRRAPRVGKIRRRPHHHSQLRPRRCRLHSLVGLRRRSEGDCLTRKPRTLIAL